MLGYIRELMTSEPWCGLHDSALIESLFREELEGQVSDRLEMLGEFTNRADYSLLLRDKGNRDIVRLNST